MLGSTGAPCAFLLYDVLHQALNSSTQVISSKVAGGTVMVIGGVLVDRTIPAVVTEREVSTRREEVQSTYAIKR